MPNAFTYKKFVTRNSGFISAETQAKIRTTKLLVAGCGMGSAPAVCLVWFFPATSKLSLADIIAPDVAKAKIGEAAPAYVDVYRLFIQRIAAHLDRDVVEYIAKVLTLMKDGTPCPASQIAVGTFAVAAMVLSMAHDLLAGISIPSAPSMVIHSFKSHQTKIIDIDA